VPVAFHAHSIDSHDWAQRPNADAARNDRQRLSTDAGLEEFLDEVAGHFRIVCITDHMLSDYACRLAQAAQKRDDITVLPGVEINCEAPPSYGDCIHLLAVFPPDADPGVIERIFAGCGLVGSSKRKGTETVRFNDLRELRDRIHNEGNGLFILAHVENPKRGHRIRFIADRGKTLRTMVDGQDLKQDLAAEYAVYLANLQPDAVELKTVDDQRHYAPFETDGKRTNVACVAPADHHSFEDYERPNTATFLKLPAADFRSVRDALLFHDTRVRLPGQVIAHGAPRLVGLRLVSPSGNGLFADTTVAFSPNLTCLIGPRGSGKSTIIEGLRYVLGRNAILEERTLDVAPSFANLAQGIQGANLQDTRLELVYEDAAGSQAILQATFDPDEPVRTRVFSPAGHDLKIAEDVIASDFPVSIFSWSEMEVLGRQPGLQRELVDRLLSDMTGLLNRREELRAELAENRAELAGVVTDLIAARSANGGILGRYRQYSDAYNAINTDEVAELFEGLDTTRAREDLLSAVHEELDEVQSAVEPIAESAIAERVDALVAEFGETTRSWWEEVAAQLKLAELDEAAKTAAGELSQAVQVRQESVAALGDAASAEAERVEQDLRAKTRLDEEQDLLRDQRELARERFGEATTAREEYLARLTELDERMTKRGELLKDLSSAQDAISSARALELTALNDQLAAVGGDRLNITVERAHLGDRRDVTDFLNERVLTQQRAGRYLQKKIAERLCAMIRPTALSAALVAGDLEALSADALVGSGEALTVDEAVKLLEGCSWRRHDEDAAADVVDDDVITLLELAEQPLDDRVSIQLNGRAVDELSPGQRSSAMLPLIALAETGPLIIDQPEDNLDNAMVGETLTRILADLKERRQIIVSTHNPNIVVGGDAEQVVVLDAEDADTADLRITGSIDDRDVIEAVLSVMEGGREAFQTRSRRYGVA
jgi:energy-coupling factor transporter ATP-binding protein EcfA2